MFTDSCRCQCHKCRERVAMFRVDICALAELSLPKPSQQKTTTTIRPERPTLALHSLKDDTAREHWTSNAFQTHSQLAFKQALQVLLRGMGGSFSAFTDSWIYLNYHRPIGSLDKELRSILACTAAILWDMHTHRATNNNNNNSTDYRPQPPPPPPPPVRYKDAMLPSHHNPLLSPLLEHMLLVDYGIGDVPLRKPRFTPARRMRRYWLPALYKLGAQLVAHADACARGDQPVFMQWISGNEDLDDAKLHRCGDAGDVALMLYYFYSYRRKITLAEHNAGLTGYSGVIDEMVADVPHVGADRLLRKLSVDLTVMIPKHVSDHGRRARMSDIILSIARQNGILHLLKPDLVPEAPAIPRERLAASSTPVVVEPAVRESPVPTRVAGPSSSSQALLSSSTPPGNDETRQQPAAANSKHPAAVESVVPEPPSSQPPPYQHPPSYPPPPSYIQMVYDEVISESPGASQQQQQHSQLVPPFVPLLTELGPGYTDSIMELWY